MQQQLHIQIGEHNVTLRPSLQAASSLLAGGDISSVFRAIAGVSLHAISSLIHAAQFPANRLTQTQIAEALISEGIHRLSDIATELLSFMATLIPADEDGETETSESVTITEYLDRLFTLSTGFIGWTPEATWNATPTEIMAAVKTRMDFWSSLFGGESEKKAKYDETRDEDGIEDLRLMSNARR